MHNAYCRLLCDLEIGANSERCKELKVVRSSRMESNVWGSLMAQSLAKSDTDRGDLTKSRPHNPCRPEVLSGLIRVSNLETDCRILILFQHEALNKK